jgi:hypothetical protein
MPVTTLRLDRPPAQSLHSLRGFGAQFNTNLFTSAGQNPDLTDVQLNELRKRIESLKPGHSRIFVRKTVRPPAAGKPEPPEFSALMRTIELAQRTGADVNLTWWQGPYASEPRLRQLRWPRAATGDAKWPPELKGGPGALTGPKALMDRFAEIIERAHAAGHKCVTHLTIQNEVNESRVDIAKQKNQNLSMRLYELLYRHLDRALTARRDPNNPGRSLRACVKLVGGDLVEKGNSHQDAWLKYMARNMADVLDGYSIHVYWDPSEFPTKPLRRLKALDTTIEGLGVTKPIYVTEYGVKLRGATPEPGMVGDKGVEELVDTALQHAWFNAVAPQYGCVGLAKWVLYRTDLKAEFGHWGMIDAPGESFTRFPTYFVTWLFTHLIDPGWRAGGLGLGEGGKLVASRFVLPDLQESVLVINTLSQSRQVRVGGLTSARYFAAVWNRDGLGKLHGLNRVSAQANTVTVDVPPRGVVALSTRAFMP